MLMPFGLASYKRLKPTFLTIAMLSGSLRARIREASSLRVISRVQCKLFYLDHKSTQDFLLT